MKRIVLTITADPNFDQRMRRICQSLHDAGYRVCLVGRKRPSSQPLIPAPYEQIRIPQWIDRGKLFYLFFNLKLFFFLLFRKADAICAIDLDTILPVFWVSRIRGIPRVYDAHELFPEIEESASRPRIQRIWRWIEGYTVPNFRWGYTVNQSYQDFFRERYGVNYAIVRNATVWRPYVPRTKSRKTLLYQGAVNKGRCFDELIEAMKEVDAELIICGEGNYYDQARALVRENGLSHKIHFTGYLSADQLLNYTREAYIGITLFVSQSLSNRLSLANRFFDYMHQGLPQLAMDYPEYRKMNEEFEIAYLLKEPSVENIARGLNRLLEDREFYRRLSDNALRAREKYHWQNEEKALLGVYQNLFHEPS